MSALCVGRFDISSETSMAYSWLLQQYIHCPWLQTGGEKKTTTIPRFFDVCESGSAEAVLFEKSIFLLRILSAYRFRNRSAQMVVHPCDLKYIIDQGPFQKRAYSFSINGLCISRTPT